MSIAEEVSNFFLLPILWNIAWLYKKEKGKMRKNKNQSLSK